MSFQLNCKHAFLTYPRCPVDKQDAFDFFLEKFNPAKLCVAHELHQDGVSHLHVYMSSRDGTSFRTRRRDFFDLHAPDGLLYGGNYQSCRSAKAVLKYCTKKEDYVANFDVDSSDDPNRKQMAKDILENKLSPVDAVEKYPHLLFGYVKFVDDLKLFFQDIMPPVELPLVLPNSWGKIIYSDKRCKKRHYWIFSRQANLGKTTFALQLQDDYKAVVQFSSKYYWDVTKNTNIIVLDEYNTPRYTWDELNAMADGTYGYRVIRQGNVVPRKPLIIILSNQSIANMYKPEHLSFLYARFNEYEL